MKKKKTKRILGASLKKANRKTKLKEPLWKGPEEDGVTQSLLNRFLMCRERFRILVVEGLQPVDSFRHQIEYGSMWHICEEEWAKTKGADADWARSLFSYAKKLCQKHPTQQEQVRHWYYVCMVQFPIYVEYWKKHQGKQQRTSLLQEQTFSVPYKLPSGRVVILKGKWDGVDLLGKGRNAGIYLPEHKTKGDIKEEQIKRQLQFDLQTMFYLVALQETQELCLSQQVPDWLDIADNFANFRPPKGVLYNVVRRPLSGGKGSIKRHKQKEYKNKAGQVTKTVPEETTEHFYERLRVIIAEEPEAYFMRWTVEVSQADVERFKREFLNPVLEQLCDWWYNIITDYGGLPGDPHRGIVIDKNPFEPSTEPFDSYDYRAPTHWRTPYGIYNVLAEGGATELDEYIATGSDLGLERATTLFRELE